MSKRDEQRAQFLAVVNQIIDEGQYPGPTLINARLHGAPGWNSLNADRCRWRREVMQARRVPMKRPPACRRCQEPMIYGGPEGGQCGGCMALEAVAR